MVSKLHGRQKRYLGITKTIHGNRKTVNKVKPKGTKSFQSKEAAEAWAKEKQLKNYEIVKPNFGLSKKFKIVLK